MLTDGKSTCYVGMTDVIVILFVSTDVVGRCFCHVDVMLIMTDVIVILFVSTDVVGRCFCHVDVMANNAILTDVMVTLCYCD